MNFDDVFDRVLGHEGGYVFNADDPGGETNWGISKRSYPDLDIKGLTKPEAKHLFKRDFWDLIDGDQMVDGLAYQAMDFAVHSGMQTSIRYLQRAVGVADDGYWGPVTREACKALSELEVCVLFLAERLDFLRKLKKAPVFMGWFGRIAVDLRHAVKDSQCS